MNKYTVTFSNSSHNIVKLPVFPTKVKASNQNKHIYYIPCIHLDETDYTKYSVHVEGSNGDEDVTTTTITTTIDLKREKGTWFSKTNKINYLSLTKTELKFPDATFLLLIFVR